MNNPKLTCIYFGSSSQSAWLLQQLVEHITIPLKIISVITQPDKPVGRKQIITPNAVKDYALRSGIPVYDEKLSYLKNTSVLDTIDLCIVFAYGKIIPSWILEKPHIGCWNIHPSLLPLYRGASPIVYPLILGETTTGVTLIEMDAELDHGPIIRQEKAPIDNFVQKNSLEILLVSKALRMLEKEIDEIIKQEKDKVMIQKNEQKHNSATYTRELTKDDGYIPFDTLHAILTTPDTHRYTPPLIVDYYEKNPHAIENTSLSDGKRVYNWFRGITPWPGMWTHAPIHNEYKRLKIIDMVWSYNTPVLTTVQLEGKNPVDFATFQRAYKLFTC